MLISVIIPTYNPTPRNLSRVIASLLSQSYAHFEVLIIDNNSTVPVVLKGFTEDARVRLVRESRQGLTYARLCGLREAVGDVLTWVDDDNVLDSHYLSVVFELFSTHQALGAVGGKSIPEFVGQIPGWFVPDLAPIGCRDLGDDFVWMDWNSTNPSYPRHAPIGAGLAIRKQAMQIWAEQVETSRLRQSLGRTGTSLASGEDNDINLTLLKSGWKLAYCPSLKLTHIIPASRLEVGYQRKLARASFRDFVRILSFHGIRPWTPLPRWSRWGLTLRYFFIYKPWRSGANSVRFHGALGQLDGRIAIARSKEQNGA